MFRQLGRIKIKIFRVSRVNFLKCRIAGLARQRSMDGLVEETSKLSLVTEETEETEETGSELVVSAAEQGLFVSFFVFCYFCGNTKIIRMPFKKAHETQLHKGF